MQKDIRAAGIKKIEIKKPARKEIPLPQEPIKTPVPPTNIVQPKEIRLPEPTQQIPPPAQKNQESKKMPGPIEIDMTKVPRNTTIQPGQNQITKSAIGGTKTDVKELDKSSELKDPYRELI